MTKRLTVAAYVILGSLLAWSRLAGLRTGYCCDEIRTVTEYVREGPRTILSGPYIPNNHELFSLLGWATSSAVGESAIALRLWSVIPFLIGVAVVTVWLHARMNALSGLLFLFLATVSPLLLDITRMARGYGLAFCAMSIVIVAALELDRSATRLALLAFVAAGLVGSFTLPHFAIAFVATGLALLARRDIGVPVAIGTGLVMVATLGWYAPHLDEFADSRLAEYGLQIPTSWIVTAPIDQTLVPAVTLLDESFVQPSFASLVWTIAFAVVIGSSPLLRQVRTALILCSGVVASVLAFWVTWTFVVPASSASSSSRSSSLSRRAPRPSWRASRRGPPACARSSWSRRSPLSPSCPRRYSSPCRASRAMRPAKRPRPSQSRCHHPRRFTPMSHTTTTSSSISADL